MWGREVGGCDLSKAHAVGLLPDLRQPQPLLHLAVPGAGQGGQLGRGSLGPSRPTWSPGPTCGRLASCAARRGARAAASPASRAAAPATCRTCAQSRPSARSPPGEGGLGSSSGSHGPGLPPAPAPLRSVRGMPWRPPHPRIQLGSSFRKDPSRAPSAPLRSQGLPWVHRLNVTHPVPPAPPPRGSLGSSLALTIRCFRPRPPVSTGLACSLLAGPR